MYVCVCMHDCVNPHISSQAIFDVTAQIYTNS